jgi:hypothetical protein
VTDERAYGPDAEALVELKRIWCRDPDQIACQEQTYPADSLGMNDLHAPAAQPPALSTFIAEPFRVGDPDVAGNLAVFPLFGPPPRLEYLSFSQGREAGVSVGELEGGASVNDLTIHNPSDKPVLLFEGEEVLGAQQNRTFDVPVLVAAGAKLTVPVSCMERGRWDGSRHRERFVPSPQTAGPAMRRMKALQARELLAVGGEARADQAAVWSTISETSDRLGAHSPTDAMHDVFESRRDQLAEAAEKIRLDDGQTGAIAAIGGHLYILDYVSRPDVYASLHGPLVQGYALDALDAHPDGDTDPPETQTASGFALLAGDAPIGHRRPGVSLGEEIRFEANCLSGSGLVHDDELVQVSVHTDDPGEGTAGPRMASAGRIRRPSGRRHGRSG